MNKFLREWFSFYRNDRIGIIILLSILLVVTIAPSFIKEKRHTEDTFNLKRELDCFLEKDSIAELFRFDPNKTDSIDFIKLGLTKEQISIIINYRNKGGKFKSKTDFKKIYSISDDLYNKLDPFIEIRHKASNELFYFNPNTLDSIGFIKLGFSPKQTKVILNYRNKGGFFKKKEDFKKVYVVNEYYYNRLQHYITLP